MTFHIAADSKYSTETSASGNVIRYQFVVLNAGGVLVRS